MSEMFITVDSLLEEFIRSCELSSKVVVPYDVIDWRDNKITLNVEVRRKILEVALRVDREKVIALIKFDRVDLTLINVDVYFYVEI